MKNLTRKIIFSSDTFQGFTVMIDIFNFQKITDIESFCTGKLLQVLDDNNFKILVKKAECSRFHIHGITFEQIQNNPGIHIYICDKCEKHNKLKFP